MGFESFSQRELGHGAYRKLMRQRAGLHFFFSIFENCYYPRHGKKRQEICIAYQESKYFYVTSK